jgi:hypothetical protein
MHESSQAGQSANDLEVNAAGAGSSDLAAGANGNSLSIPGATAVRGSGGRTTIGGAGAGGTGIGANPKVSGPGVTATTIYIGDVYAINADALNQAAGVSGITQGDPQADMRAIVDDINKHGGMAGRKVEPVFQQFDSTSTQTIDQQYAAICAHFTQDEPRVFAVLGQMTPAARQCFMRAGVPNVDADLPTADTAEFERDPFFIEMGYPNLDRIGSYFVTALSDQKYFVPWDIVNGAPSTAPTAKASVGVLTFDSPAFKHATNTFLVPGLKALGFTPQVEYIASVNTASDYSSEAAAISSAALKFRSSNVDHVIIFDSNGSLSLFFMREADSQHYYPRYGGHTGSAFQALIGGDPPIVPRDQLRGALGFGWAPGIDLPSDQNADNGPYSTESRRHCLGVFKAHGIEFADPNAEGVALEYCDNLYLLRAALNQTPTLINAFTFVAAVERLSDSFEPAGTFAEHFVKGRHDGLSRVYYFSYLPNCQCFHYSGPLRTIP